MSATVTLDLTALQHNFDQVKKRCPKQKILAMVKANAYGHGLELIANKLQSADFLGVASLNEALRVRQVNIQTPIVIMQGVFNQSQLNACVAHGLQPVIHDPTQLESLKNLDRKISLWLKINTGMNRLGFEPQQAQLAYQIIKQHPAVKSITALTHFACADDRNNNFTNQQIQSFIDSTYDWPLLKSCANSAAIIQHPNSYFDIVRPGLMLYGASPIIGVSASELNLKPVMQLSANIIAIHQLETGQSLGYGHTWKAKKSTRVACVDIGYGDGYPQFAPESTPALLNNQQTNLIGRVSMDSLTIDISELKDISIGDEVLLWGDKLPVETIARHTNSSSYALLTGISKRVARQLLSVRTTHPIQAHRW